MCAWLKPRERCETGRRETEATGDGSHCGVARNLYAQKNTAAAARRLAHSHFNVVAKQVNYRPLWVTCYRNPLELPEPERWVPRAGLRHYSE